jgi:adenylylsulfate kinase
MSFDSKKNTALLIGRYQGFHLGHRTLILEALKRADQALIAVRDTYGTDEKNPFNFETVKKSIEEGMYDVLDKIQIILVPNITNILYGRDVGYKIEKIELGEAIESISATAVRKQMGY